MGIIPFVRLGGMLASETANLFHIIGVMPLVIPISTWFFQLTGRVHLGALLNAFLVAGMFTSSQVIAPIPICWRALTLRALRWKLPQTHRAEDLPSSATRFA